MERIIIRKDMILTTILILSIIPFSLIMISIPIVASGFISNVSSAIMIFCLFIFGVLEFFSLVIVIVGTIELLELIFFYLEINNFFIFITILNNPIIFIISNDFNKTRISIDHLITAFIFPVFGNSNSCI